MNPVINPVIPYFFLDVKYLSKLKQEISRNFDQKVFV